MLSPQGMIRVFFVCVDKSNRMDTILKSFPEPRNAHVARKDILLYLTK